MKRLEHRFPVYTKLITLYPTHYRTAYGQQMLQTLADMLDGTPSRSERFAIRARLAADFPVSLTVQHIHYLGGIMANKSPRYVMRNALISAGLLVPFTLAITANALDKILNNETLYGSWLWHAPILALWVLWLPMVATVMTLASLATYLAQRLRAKHPGTVKAILDIRKTWPLLLVATAGLCILAIIFGHDSAHCILGNPIHEAKNIHQTLHCLQQGSVSPAILWRRTLGLGQ